MVYANKPLDFVSIPTNNDESLSLILSDYGGFKAFGVITALFAFIGRTGGYYVHWNTLAKKRFLHEFYWEGKVNDGLNYVDEIVNVCFRTNIFDKEIYKKYQVLTGYWSQKTFKEPARKRKSPFIEMNYVLSFFQTDYLELSKKGDFFSKKGDFLQGREGEAEVEVEEINKGDSIDCSLRSIEESTPLIEKFKSECPTKIVDCDRIPKFVDIHLLIKAIKESSFLTKRSPNFTLKYMCGQEKYFEILQGKYAVDWNKSKTESNTISRVEKVSEEEAKAWSC